MGPIVRALAAGIGLARESHLSKNAARQNEQTRAIGENEPEGPQINVHPLESSISDPGAKPGADPDSTTTADEMVVDVKGLSLRPTDFSGDDELPLYGSWELDEAQDTLAEQESPSNSKKVVGPGIMPQKDIPYLAEKFADTYPITDVTKLMRLNCSVILPQRRPDSRKRGFIRAYSPVLAAKDIDEQCFLDFIDTFNVASQANPLLHAINLASFAANALPIGIGIAVSEAIRLAVDTTVELQSRYRTNRFLDQINRLWFLPRGLVCFPMIWKPSVSSLVTSVTMENTATTQADGLDQKTSTIGKFAGGAAVTRGNVAFPDAAPLTFPLLDDLAESNDEQSRTVKQKIAASMKFANEYMDRRAQATYAMKNPHSGLTHLGVRPEFRSRYSDPSHPAASGSLLGLVTGGKISLGNRARARRQNQRGRLLGGPLALGSGVGGTVFDKPGVENATTAVADFMRDVRLSNVIRTMRGKQVLYLVVVDAPTQQEVEEAQQILSEMGSCDQGHAAADEWDTIGRRASADSGKSNPQKVWTASELYATLARGIQSNPVHYDVSQDQIISQPLYRELNEDKLQIRFLDVEPIVDSSPNSIIQCKLKRVSLLDRPIYAALSYRWGEPGASTTEIYVDGHPRLVITSLAEALRHLRWQHADTTFLLWVDSICINQVNKVEKARQILLMNRIFGRASCVYGWLGINSAETPGLLDILQRLVAVAPMGREISVIDLETGLKSLSKNGYWRRVWIIQELASAEKLFLVWGRYKISWDDFRQASKTLAFRNSFETVSVDALETLHFFRHQEQNIWKSPTRIPLLDALTRSRVSLATEPRDKLFALLNMTSDGRDIVSLPNYTQSWREIILDVASGIIVRQRKIAAVLLHCRSNKNTQDRLDHLPSWIPNWAALDEKLPPWIIQAIAAKIDSTAPPIAESAETLTIPRSHMDTIKIEYLDAFERVLETKSRASRRSGAPPVQDAVQLVFDFAQAGFSEHSFTRDSPFEEWNKVERAFSNVMAKESRRFSTNFQAFKASAKIIARAGRDHASMLATVRCFVDAEMKLISTASNTFMVVFHRAREGDEIY